VHIELDTTNHSAHNAGNTLVQSLENIPKFASSVCANNDTLLRISRFNLQWRACSFAWIHLRLTWAITYDSKKTPWRIRRRRHTGCHWIPTCDSQRPNLDCQRTKELTAERQYKTEQNLTNEHKTKVMVHSYIARVQALIYTTPIPARPTTFSQVQ